MANKWVKYDHSNYPPGGPLSANYLADADEFNQNYEDICDAVGARYIRGIACADKNSTETTCEIWLQADGAARDVCDSGWYALIYYGASKVWETLVSVSGSDCFIVFGNDQLENPTTSGISDYSDTAFIDALHIMLFPKKMMLPKDWVITTSGAAGCLSTQEIYHESESLSTFIAKVKSRVDAVLHADTGELLADVVDSTAIDGSEAVMMDSALNLLAGGSLEHYGDQHNLLFKVEAIPGSTCEITENPDDTDGSARAQKVIASGSNEGITLPLNPNFADGILAGKYVAATFRVKATVADSLEIGFMEDSTCYGTSPDITVDTWTTVTVTREITAGTDEVRAYVRSTPLDPVTFFVARAQMNIGEKAFGFSIGPYEDAAQILMDTTQDNLFYNGGFERWTLAEGAPPDGWFGEGTASFSAEAGAAVGACTGNKYCLATLAANDGMGQYLGLVTDTAYGANCVNENILVGLVRGAQVSASVDLRLDTTTSEPITLVLGDYDDTTSTEETTLEVYPLNDEMRRFTIYKEIQGDARQVYFKILNKHGTTKDVKIDNAMLHVGEFPLMFKPSAGWREMRWDFSDVTAEEGVKMDALGIQDGEYPMPQEAAAYLMLKAAVRCLTAPGSGGTDTIYQLCVDGTPANGISVAIPEDVYYADNHITDYNDVNDQCKQYLTAPECTQINGGGTEAGNVIFSVWGYYYAP
ncbi:MAG: hypothetical protein V3W11_10640 [bacterium]